MTEAWRLAHGAASAAGVALRPLVTLEDAEAILGVMVATWGEHQLIPREMLRALGDSANPPYGAFDGDELVGYVLGWLAVDEEDGIVVHSHMLAAAPDRRHRGVGYALKLAQRAQALDYGITVVRWTFDPLVARNAWFNLGKLGAMADRFHRDFYGEMTDTVNRGERSDRLVVRWDLAPEPGPWSVPLQGDPLILRRVGDLDAPRPGRVADPSGAAAILEIPGEYYALRERNQALASAWRDAVADAIEACREVEMFAVMFARERSCYVFGRTRGRAGEVVP